MNKSLNIFDTLVRIILFVIFCFHQASVPLFRECWNPPKSLKNLQPPLHFPLLFLWRDVALEQAPDVYQWQVLPFGTTCSPCCATFALQKHVLDHSQPGDQVREVIEKSFYVDNCMYSLTNKDAAKELVDQLCSLLAEGGFELRQWASNCLSVISHLPPELRSNSCELWLSQ